jgi:predicted nucleotidyltransferase
MAAIRREPMPLLHVGAFDAVSIGGHQLVASNPSLRRTMSDNPTLAALLDHAHPGLLFECVSGSRAYGTATADSDEDLRGVFALPAADYLALTAPPAQIADARNNSVYLSLRRVLELLAAGNPSVLELLYMPADCVRFSMPVWERLVVARATFITLRCAQAHIGYAQTQIKKARGQNKWINQPKPEAPPRMHDYCRVIRADRLVPVDSAPCRPQTLAEFGIDLARCHAARLEHTPGVFRLYDYGDRAQGVFRGDTLSVVSIPLDDEAPRFVGLLLYNEQAWRQASLDHSNYWTWRRERNEARWRQQERGELDYDAKNLMHTVRLLLSGESILRDARPIVRFEGAPLELLMDIRRGRYSYDEVLEIASDIVARCEALQATSKLPESTSIVQADRLLRELSAEWEAART